MSTSSEYESTARQDYGPATASENVYEQVLDHKLAENMNVQSIRTPVLRAVPQSPNEGDPEPDSTNHESIIQSSHKADKEVEYHIAEKTDDTEMSADLLKIDDSSVVNMGPITYPLLQDSDHVTQGNYVENTATLIQTPLSTAIVQNVTKLPQNYTIVDAAVSNITTIQNVSQDGSSSQTLWLPTILTTSTAACDGKGEDDRPQAGVSQIIITSESYTNDTHISRRSNIVTETNYITRPKASKVQILSNISLPKNPTYSQQYITQTKEIATATPVYATQNHVYKLSTNVVTQKHLTSSVLCTKTPKSQSLIGCSTLTQSVINSSPIKNVAYSHTFTKSTNMKTLNKVNNGANLNAMVAASSGGTQCHILSRVVSGPNKMSVHSGRKSVNTFKGSKSGQNPSQKNQSRPIKIIQQAGSAHKSDAKTWPVASVTYKNHQGNYGVMDANTSKIIQKVGSPTNKHQAMPLHKCPAKGERLVLQSPCGPVLLSSTPVCTSLPKGPHYVQSGTTPNLRYVQTYGSADNQMSTVSQVSANQQLTAQILQSLSQPKLMLQTSPTSIKHFTAVTSLPAAIIEDPVEPKPVYQKRIIMGDKSTLLTADDLIGMEERPNLSEELRRYSLQPLAFVMLDHTYSQPAQKLPQPAPRPVSPAPAPPAPSASPAPTLLNSPPIPLPAPAPPTTPVFIAPPATLAIISPPVTTVAPISPMKRTSPVIVSNAQYELPIAVPTVIGTTVPLSSIQMAPIAYKPQLLLASPVAIAPPAEDDAASVVSSVDGERKPPAGGSDTETAPEGEEEGKTRCICEFTHDDGYMICCDRCGEWQHVDCMGIDRNNIPDAYMCEMCLPRPVDRRHARAIQMRKREELSALGASDSDSSELMRGLPGQRRRRLLTVTTYTDTSGSCVTTYNSGAPVLPPLPRPQPSLPLPKRGPIPKAPPKPRKTELLRKGAKRKLAEKRVKRKKEMILNRSKYGSSLSNQSHWQDAYELAVTNHYSPELRAKIMKYSNKLGSQPNMAYATNAHLCTTVPHAGGKILIATKDLKENMPIIELRGKYMLSNQHRPQLQNAARAGGQKPGPFVFFYRLPKDNIQICIDTRTYGNEARFARRSCKPNAELQHCIVKGTIHVYLVTTGVVQANTEVTVGHDADGSKQPCACGNPKHCKVNGLNSPLPPRKSFDYPPREKRSRNRCFSSSSPVSPPPMPFGLPPGPLTPPVREPPYIPSIMTIKPEQSPIKYEYPPVSPAKPVIVSPFEEPVKIERSFEFNNGMVKVELMEPEPVKTEPPPVDFPKTEPIEEEPFEEPKLEMDLTSKEVMKPEDYDEPDFCKVEEKVEDVPLPPMVSIPEPLLEMKVEIKEEPKPVVVPKLTTPKPIVSPKVEEEKEKLFVPKVEKILERRKSRIRERIELYKDETSDDEPLEKVERDDKKPLELKAEPQLEDDKFLTKEDVAKSACHDRSSRSSRNQSTCVNQDSLDDKTDDSQDKITPKSKDKDKRKMTREERKMEAIMKAFERMEKAQQRKQEVKERQKRRESDPHPNAMDKEDEEEIHCATKKRRKRKGRARTTSQSNRRRLNSADSDMVTSGDEAPMPPTTPTRTAPPMRRNSTLPMPSEPDRHNEPHESYVVPHGYLERTIGKREVIGHEIGLSSACLLVEAAVGSVENAFKLPKTKKTMATEWIGRSPERTPSPYRSPYRPALVSQPSLESLVRVASTMIGDLSETQDPEHDDCVSPPRTPGRDRNRPPKKSRRITRSTPVESPAEVPEVIPQILPQHSAKKRWLRQAISEECDQINVPESPPNEMYTPLKKRRLARESLSCEQTTVPCIEESSPVLTSEDSPVKDEGGRYADDLCRPYDDPCRQYKIRNIMESMYGARDRTRSDSGQGSDDQCNMDNDVLNVNLKGPHDSENIRRIIGVPTPEEELPPEIPRPDQLNTNNNNLELEESNYNKVVPMDIDTTILQPKIQETIGSTIVDPKRIESPTEKLNSCQSADTSGNSSPQRDEMDDIQKKIHSFHTENIMILKSRNKKPKEKRKKVNLNFDLNMVDDQISIQLLTESDGEPEVNGDVHDEVSLENIPLPPVESIPLPPSSMENIPLPEDPSPLPLVPPPEMIPLPEPITQIKALRLTSPVRQSSRRISPIKDQSPERQISPPVRHTSPVHRSSLARASPVHTSPPLRRASPVLRVSPVRQSPIRRASPVRQSPIRRVSPVRQSPIRRASPVRQSPIVRVSPVRQSPIRRASPVRQSPIRRASPIRKSPIIRVSPVRQSPIRRASPIRKSPIRRASPIRKSPIRRASPIRQSPIRRGASPIRKSPITRASPIRQSPIRRASPITSPVRRPSPKRRASPIQPTSAHTPVPTVSPAPEKPDIRLNTDRPSVLDTVSFSTRFSATGLFSGIFNNMQTFNVDPIGDNVPNMSIIKSAIDRTTSLDNSLFDKDSITQSDEMKSVQEILTRVNNMDSNNSVLLSGVLKNSNKAGLVPPPSPKPVAKPYCPRINDPRLNPPPVEKPKPIRRKLSITEYRKRHKGGADESSDATGESAPTEAAESSSSALSPQRLEAAVAQATDELELRLHRELAHDQIPKGVFDAQPTASERQRENLSSRLRREFGLALPEDDDARPPTEPSGTNTNLGLGPLGEPFGCLGDLAAQAQLQLGTWTPPEKTRSVDAWQRPHATNESNSLPGHDNLVLLGQTAQDVASLECRPPPDSGDRSPFASRRFKWGRRGV